MYGSEFFDVSYWWICPIIMIAQFTIFDLSALKKQILSAPSKLGASFIFKRSQRVKNIQKPPWLSLSNMVRTSANNLIRI